MCRREPWCGYRGFCRCHPRIFQDFGACLGAELLASNTRASLSGGWRCSPYLQSSFEEIGLIVRSFIIPLGEWSKRLVSNLTFGTTSGSWVVLLKGSLTFKHRKDLGPGVRKPWFPYGYPIRE